MPAVMRERFSKTGWPVNATAFSFGHARSHDAAKLAAMILVRFHVKVKLGVDQDGYRNLASEPIRLGQRKCAEIVAFVQGYLAAN